MRIQYLRGEEQKQSLAAVEAIFARIAPQKVNLQGNPYAGRRAIELGRRYAIGLGIPGAEVMSDVDVGRWMLGMRSANVSTGMFDSYVLANVMDKAVAEGFNGFGENATYPRWTRIRQVSDFKEVTGGAIDVGNLQETVENAPFPELTKAEFGYTSKLAMWGVTASLSLQALINDDLDQFMNQIFRSGQMANRTIEKEVYSKLEGATWTNNTTASAGLGSAGTPTPANLDKPRADFLNKTGPAGEKLENVPKFLIHTPNIALDVAVALGKVINYGGVAQGSGRASSMEGIETPYLTGTNTTYYLAGDPGFVDTVVILMLNGMLTPQIEQYDSGAVAAKKYKIYLPFKAKPVITSIDGTNYAPGLQQATA